jgi:hypothetical protein
VPKLSVAEHSRKAFALHYRRHVVPQLQNLITAEARCVAANIETFSGACDVVHRYARKHGGLHLDPADWQALEEWIELELLKEITRAEAEGWDRWPHMRGGA